MNSKLKPIFIATFAATAGAFADGVQGFFPKEERDGHLEPPVCSVTIKYMAADPYHVKLYRSTPSMAPGCGVGKIDDVAIAAANLRVMVGHGWPKGV